MTSIATKGGAVIVKDGKAAEGCKCCGGVCVCDATAVTVSVLCETFLRHLLLRYSPGGQNPVDTRVSLGFIAAPSSGVHVLRKDTVAPEAGLSASKWVSSEVPSPGKGRITAVVYRAAANAPMRVTIGIPVWYWRSVGDNFKSIEEMIAESKAGSVSGQGYGTLVVELECDSQSGSKRILSIRPVVPGSGWSPDGSQIPLLACDFTNANRLQGGGSVWWEGAAMSKGQERLLGMGFNIVSDTRTGSNIVMLDSVGLSCCEDETGTDGACCTTAAGVTTCDIKPQCQCQGTGKVFKGVGTVCTSDLCNPLP